MYTNITDVKKTTYDFFIGPYVRPFTSTFFAKLVKFYSELTGISNTLMESLYYPPPPPPLYPIPYSNTCYLRSDNKLLITPRVKQNTYEEGSFQYAAPSE